MREHSVRVEFVHLRNVSLEYLHHAREFFQLLARHFIDNELAALFRSKLAHESDEVVQPLHKIRRKIGISRIQALDLNVLLERCLQACESIDELLVRLRRLTAAKLLLTRKVD